MSMTIQFEDLKGGTDWTPCCHSCLRSGRKTDEATYTSNGTGYSALRYVSVDDRRSSHCQTCTMLMSSLAVQYQLRAGCAQRQAPSRRGCSYFLYGAGTPWNLVPINRLKMRKHAFGLACNQRREIDASLRPDQGGQRRATSQNAKLLKEGGFRLGVAIFYPPNREDDLPISALRFARSYTYLSLHPCMNNARHT